VKRYPRPLKEAMVTRLCSPGGPTICKLSEETGINRATLYYWLRELGKGEKKVSKEKRPMDWGPKERLQVVFEASNLSEADLGVFLRKKGLFFHHIEEWKKEALESVSKTPARGRPCKDPEVVAVEKENRKLKQELRRKDKVLAEQTALIILKKKAHEIWGRDPEDESS